MTNRNTKWILALLLCAAMALGLGMVNADSEITTWSELQAALSAGGTVTLTRNITASQNQDALVIPAGVNVMLDLNGKRLSIVVRNNADDGLFVVNGALTVTDSAGGGVMVSDKGDVVRVNSGGSFTMENGTIQANENYDSDVKRALS
ncbi:MAG: hypothetical protein IKP40_05555 [Clostridia bacterium]|nr:hypothetical protein [Clostridia bacterium]